MKHVVKTLSVLALLLGVASCQISSVDDGVLINEKLSVTAVIDETSATRVTYTVDNEVAFTVTPTWTVGDKIIGFDDKGVKFTFTVETEADGTAALNVGTYVPGEATKLYAIYAPGMTEDQIVNQELALDLSAQDGALNTHSKVWMCATAAIEAGEVRFHFEKATAIVGLKKFQIPVSFTTAVTKMKLNGVATTGTFRVVDGSLTFVPDTNTGTVTATRTWMTNSSGLCTTPVYFSVVPTKDAELSIDAETPSKSYINVTPIDKLDIAAGYYYHMSKIFYGPEAEMNGVSYGSIVEAFDAANEINDPVVIRLLSNCQATEPIVLCNAHSAGYTLDLNGKKLTTTATNTFTLSLCTMTITDSSTDDPAAYGALTTESSNTSKYVIYVQDEAMLKMAKGSIVAPAYRCVCLKDGGSAELSGNSVVSSPNGYALYLTDTGGTLDIKDDARISGKGNVVYYGTGASTLTGGIISNTASGAIVYVSGDAELTVGGNCRINTTYAANRNPVYANGSAKAYVTGGYYGMPIYNVVSHDAEDNKYVNVLNEDPATSADYPYTVIAAPGNVVEVSTASADYTWDFGTLEAAFNHADYRSTQFAASSVVLSKDLQLSEPVSFPSSHQYGLTLNLNGFKISSTASPAVTTAGHLAVEDAIGTGEIITTGDVALEATAGTISFIGASLTGATTAFAAKGTAAATVNSGWFAGGTEDITKEGSAKVEIYGGRFKNAPAAGIIAEGCEANSISETHNGHTYNYQVVGGVAAAKVNGEDCPSFANALATALAYNGSDEKVTLTLMKDVLDYDKQLDLTNKNGKPFVLDLNGHTLGVVIDSCMTTTGDLTIMDGSGTGTGMYTSTKRKQLYLFTSGTITVKDCIIDCQRGGYMATGATYTMIAVVGTSSSPKAVLTFDNAIVRSKSYLKPIYISYGTLNILGSEMTCGQPITPDAGGGYYIVDVYTGGKVTAENSSFLTYDRRSNGDKYGCLHTRTGNTGAGSSIIVKDCWFQSGKGLSTHVDHPEYSKVFTIYGCYSSVDFTQYLPDAVYGTGLSLQAINPPATHLHKTTGLTYEYGYQVK